LKNNIKAMLIEKEHIELSEEMLVERLKRYNEAYRIGEPLIGDEKYDSLLENLRKINSEHPFLQVIEPERFDLKKEIKHPLPMLSIEKAYTKNDIQRFISRVEKEALKIGIEDFEFVVTPKLDGIAARDDAEFLVTRGNGETGFEISSVFEKGIIPINGRGGGLGEIVVVKSYFDKFLSDKFEHPRNMIAGIVASDNLNEHAKKALEDKKIHFVSYPALPRWRGSSSDLLKNIDNITKELIKTTDYPIDGMVAFVDDERIKEYMGATAHHYRWQIAIKVRGATAVTEVLDIIWQVGRSGNITPVLAVEPVFLSGATIRRVTAHHAGMIKKMNIGVGAKIEIIRSGEVIPKLEKVIDTSFFDIYSIPKKCPSCASALVFQNDFLKCINHKCLAQIEQRIYHFFKTLGNADWFGIKTIQKLVAKGYDNISKIYAMDEKDFIDSGFGPVQSKNLFSAIQTSLIKEVEDWRFLSAFGILNLGKGDSRKLLLHIGLKDIANKKIEPEEIEKIYGFGEITSKSIASGIGKISDLLKHMLSLNFHIIKTKVLSEKEDKQGFFYAKRVVFTGKMASGTRDEMQDKARILGAIVIDAVSSKTDYFICGKNVGPKKLEKAAKLGIEMIDEKRFLELINA
jgi:DNA ligase (NAD+)